MKLLDVVDKMVDIVHDYVKDDDLRLLKLELVEIRSEMSMASKVRKVN